jgi:phospholipid/cholesterol/gamma-HCH transport system permease protein
MQKPSFPKSYEYDLSEGPGGAVTFHIRGSVNAYNAASLLRELKEYLSVHNPSSLSVDLERTTYLDDYGVLALAELKEEINENRGEFKLENIDEKKKEILSILDFDSIGRKASLKRKRSSNIFVLFGEETLSVFRDARFMISFVGSVCISFFHICIHPKSLRMDDTFLSMQRTGVEALPIVGLISFLLGLIIAFMSSIQLRQFGADIYVASLVSVAMTYELGPIMTAIIVAGRSGSSFASEIGTMKVSEEIDALFTMGFDPTRFLVVPKLLASVIVVPVLTLFSDVFAILGGLVVGVLMLDLTTSAYVAQTFKSLTIFDIFWGVMKSGVFAVVIAWVGCLRGFQVKGGADSVGKATTSAVVSSIFLIIVIDAIFAIIHIYWL